MSEEKTKILIVDDDAELRELIAETLANYGYASESAKDGREMFAALERGGFSLVLLDIMMPGEDGLSLCRRLRAPGTRWASLPVIFLTALQETTDKVVGLEIGGDDYLGKPFQARELIARVRALLRRASMNGAPHSPAARICSGSGSMNRLTSTPTPESVSVAAFTASKCATTSSPPSVVSSCRFSGTRQHAAGFRREQIATISSVTAISMFSRYPEEARSSRSASFICRRSSRRCAVMPEAPARIASSAAFRTEGYVTPRSCLNVAT